MRRVALTGGAGCGKSTAAKIWQSLGVPCLCADDIAREAASPGGHALASLRANFEEKFFTSEGLLKRRLMRRHILHNAAAKKKLENILHPHVRRTMTAWLQQQDGCYCLIVVPLLFEAKMDDMADVIVVVDCPREIQIKRFVARDKCSIMEAERMIDSQISAQERLRRADYVIANNSTKKDLKKQIAVIHNKLVQSEYDSARPL